MFCFHKWGKWEVSNEYNIVRSKKAPQGEWYYGPPEKQSVIGKAILQKRICKKCGKTRTSMQETYLYNFGNLTKQQDEQHN